MPTYPLNLEGGRSGWLESESLVCTVGGSHFAGAVGSARLTNTRLMAGRLLDGIWAVSFEPAKLQA